MIKVMKNLVLGMLWFGFANSSFANLIDPEKFIRERGWGATDAKPTAISPSRDVVPIMFHENGNSVSSCGILLTAPGTQEPRFVELVRTEPGMTYPHCMAIDSMTAFKLGGKPYISVEYVQRETREDSYRYSTLFYLGSGGYIKDASLGSGLEDSPELAKALIGMKMARIKYIKRIFPRWRFLERHFISEKNSSFAAFENPEAHRCHFVVEAGTTPTALNHDDFVAETSCTNVLASSRLEKAGTIYYLAMFKSQGSASKVAVASVEPSGKITAEKTLSDRVNRASPVKDIRSAKLVLLEALQ
jgi:hypothetical protein